jgi:hypothetical protein
MEENSIGYGYRPQMFEYSEDSNSEDSDGLENRIRNGYAGQEGVFL